MKLWDRECEKTVAGEPFRTREKGMLKFSMVDVQQGNGMIVETPPNENHENEIVFNGLKRHQNIRNWGGSGKAVMWTAIGTGNGSFVNWP